MGLDVKVLDGDNAEIDLKQSFDDDDDLGLVPADYDEEFKEETVVDTLDGFGLQDETGEDITDTNGDGFNSGDENI